MWVIMVMILMMQPDQKEKKTWRGAGADDGGARPRLERGGLEPDRGRGRENARVEAE